MPRAEKVACRRAQVIHDLFHGDRRLALSSVLEQTGLSLAATLPAVEVLNRLELVAVMAGPEGVELRLVATPEDHVRITGPDGKDSWVFVARPLDPPSLPYSELN